MREWRLSVCLKKEHNVYFVLLRYDKCSPLKSACRICKKICQETGKKIREIISVQKSAKSSHHFQSQRPAVRTCPVSCWRIFLLGDIGSCYIGGIKWQLVYFESHSRKKSSYCFGVGVLIFLPQSLLLWYLQRIAVVRACFKPQRTPNCAELL